VMNLGIRDLRFSALIPHGGASGVGALQCAAAAIAAGICTTVLVPFGRNVSSGARAGVRIHQMPQFRLVTEFERPAGAIAPAQLYAPMARQHMQRYGTTSEQFGEIAVVCREHAILNGNAVMTKPITLADHQNSRMITDPFRLLDCSLETDGGAAYVVTSVKRARNLRQPVVELLGVAMGHPDSPNSITQRPDLGQIGIARAAPIAFAMAGAGPGDMDVAEVYDCFTYVVLRQFEDMGFCAKGRGRAVRHERAAADRRRTAHQHPRRPALPGPHAGHEPHRRTGPAAPRPGRKRPGGRSRGRPGHRVRRHG